MTVVRERRRDQATRTAILQAVDAILAEDGYAGLSVEGVARRAGVGKQSIYRWWSSLHLVVIDAMLDAGDDSTHFPDTGDLRADLHTQMSLLAQFMTSSAASGYRGLLGAAQTDRHLATELYRRAVEPRVLECRDRIAAAQSTGQVRSDIDPIDVVELVYAPFYYRLILGNRPVDEAQVGVVLELAFTGLSARPGAEPASAVQGS